MPLAIPERPFVSERRRHRVYVTRHTEYHVRDGICVGVRDRGGDFFRGHMALNRRVHGGVRLGADGLATHAGEPLIGEGLLFAEGDRSLVTGAIERVVRPAKNIVDVYYPAAQNPS